MHTISKRYFKVQTYRVTRKVYLAVEIALQVASVFALTHAHGAKKYAQNHFDLYGLNHLIHLLVKC